MMNVNKVIIVGNVGNDPDIRKMPSGADVANLSIATNEYWMDKNSQRQTRTEWNKIVIFNPNLIQLIRKFVHKGSALYIEGTLRTTKYTSSDGVERSKTEIITDVVKLLDSKPRQQGDEIQNYSNDFSSQQKDDFSDEYVDNGNDTQSSFSGGDNNDDDSIPF